MTSTPDDLVARRLEDLVLARLAAIRGGGDPGRDVAAATAALAPASIDLAGWRACVEAARERLVADGRVDGKGRARPAALTALRKRLGLRARTATPWSRLVQRVIPALALGVTADDARAHRRLVSRDDWAGAIVGRATGVWRTGAPPSVARLCDALVWRGLGLGGPPQRSPAEIRVHFAAALVLGASGPPERVIRLAAAREVGAARPDLQALKEALGRRWLAGLELAPGPWPGAPAVAAARRAPTAAAARPTAAPAPPPRRDGLPELAAAIRAAAGAATRGVFGDRKVFIVAVWRDLRGRPPVAGLDLEGFKRRLVAAHRAGLVSLARADLVGVMDPAEVAASETASAEARYHFIVREAPRDG